VLFIGLGAIFASCSGARSAPGQPDLRGLGRGPRGLVLVFSMSQIYMLRTAPAWNTLATPVTFFTTTFCSARWRSARPTCQLRLRAPHRGRARWHAGRDSARRAALAGAGGGGAGRRALVVQPLYIAHLSSSGVAAAQRAVVTLMGDYGLLFALRLGLVFLGAGVLGFFVYRSASSPGRETLLGNLGAGRLRPGAHRRGDGPLPVLRHGEQTSVSSRRPSF